MLWKMWCFILQSMGRTNHKFPVYATWDVQTHLKYITVGPPNKEHLGTSHFCPAVLGPPEVKSTLL